MTPQPRVWYSESATEFDQDGIPIWGYDEQSAFYHHASLRDVDLAMEATAVRLGAFPERLDLPQFDSWLRSLEPGPVKAELLRRRALALGCMEANDDTGMLRHLEYLLGQWRLLPIIPLARAGRRQKVQNAERAKRPRTPQALQILIAAAKAEPGTAKAQWRHLLKSFADAGYVVRESQIGNPTCEVDLPSGPWAFSLKALQNRKSR